MINMRLWHYKLIPYLPNKMLVSQWRECIAIKRQWEKGTLKHRLVSYVTNYDKSYFTAYVLQIVAELSDRNINYDKKLYDEILLYSNQYISGKDYPEHNNRYLVQCYYNLQEKADRGIVPKENIKELTEALGDLLVGDK